MVGTADATIVETGPALTESFASIMRGGDKGVRGSQNSGARQKIQDEINDLLNHLTSEKQSEHRLLKFIIQLRCDRVAEFVKSIDHTIEVENSVGNEKLPGCHWG